MLHIRRVHGHSMIPTLRPGKVVFFRKTKKYKVGDIVLVEYKDTEYVKRIDSFEKKSVNLRGDNQLDSKDFKVSVDRIKAKKI